MSIAAGRGQAHDAPFGTVAIAPTGKARRHEDDGRHPEAVRVAHVSGGASYGRSGDPEGWQPASVDLPVATGDRVYAARGACLDLRTAAFEIHLASGAGLEAIGLTNDAKRFYVWGGSTFFLVLELQPSELFAVDTPTAAVTFERAGKYQIDVDREGNTRVVVDRGSAWVSAAGVAVPLGSGEGLRIDGIQFPVHDVPSHRPLDPMDSGLERVPCRPKDQVLPFRPRQSH
jgi:hypothetical protein